MRMNTLPLCTHSSFHLFAVILTTFLSEPESQTIDEGSSVIFFCIQSGSIPPASVSWRVNGDVILSSSDISIQTSVLSHTNPPQVSSSLGFRSVSRSDTGQITCTATNPLLPGSPVTSREATLAITGMLSWGRVYFVMVGTFLQDCKYLMLYELFVPSSLPPQSNPSLPPLLHILLTLLYKMVQQPASPVLPRENQFLPLPGH